MAYRRIAHRPIAYRPRDGSDPALIVPGWPQMEAAPIGVWAMGPDGRLGLFWALPQRATPIGCDAACKTGGPAVAQLSPDLGVSFPP